MIRASLKAWAKQFTKARVGAWVKLQSVHQRWQQPPKQVYQPMIYEDYGILQCDLIDLGKYHQGGFQWSINCVECLQRYAFAQPIRSKSAADILPSWRASR